FADLVLDHHILCDRIYGGASADADAPESRAEPDYRNRTKRTGHQILCSGAGLWRRAAGDPDRHSLPIDRALPGVISPAGVGGPEVARKENQVHAYSGEAYSFLIPVCCV